MRRLIIQLKKSVSDSPEFIKALDAVVESDHADYLIGNHKLTGDEQLRPDKMRNSLFGEKPDLSLFKTIREEELVAIHSFDTALEVLSDCKDVEEVYGASEPEPVYVPNDPEWQQLWHYHKNNAYSTNAEKAWDDPDIEFGKGIVVATIEPRSEACNFNHEDFGMSGTQPIDRKNAMMNGSHPSLLASKYKEEWDIPEDEFGHATQTASMLVAQMNNGRGHTGIIPRGKCKPYYYGHAPDWDSALDAIVRAANDIEVDVISVSLTGNRDDPATVAVIQTAIALGVPVVWAAGPNKDGYEVWDTAPSAISVTSHDRHGNAKYTVGNVSLSAPGIGIYRSSPGDNVPGLSDGDDSSYWAGSGNSLATPMVAGIVGMMLKKNKSASIPDVVTALYGSCLLNGNKWNKEYGYGYVNANYALEAIIGDVFKKPLAPTRLRTTYSSYKKKFAWSDPFRSSDYKETVIVARALHAIPDPPENIKGGIEVYRGTGKYLGNGQYETEDYIWLKQAEYWFAVFNIDKEGNQVSPIGLADCYNTKTKGRLSCYASKVAFYKPPIARFEVRIGGVLMGDSGTITTITTGAGVILEFNDKPEGSRDSSFYLWDFGNGDTTTDRNPSYLFDTPGKYKVTYRCGNPLETDEASVTVGVVGGINNVKEDMKKLVAVFAHDLTVLIDKL